MQSVSDQKPLTGGVCSFGKVTVYRLEPLRRARRIEVLVEIPCFVRRVDEDVGFGNSRSSKIVGAEISPVGDGAPMIGKLLRKVAKL